MNKIILGITLLSVILTIIVYFFELRKKVKYPLLTLCLALIVTCIIVFTIKENDATIKRNSAELEKIKKDSLSKDILDNDAENTEKTVQEELQKTKDTIGGRRYIFSKNFYTTNFYEYENMYFRKRMLSKEEIDICNKCRTFVTSQANDKKIEGGLFTNQVSIYEDYDNPNCLKKIKIDNETGWGYIASGILVELIKNEKNFTCVKIVSTGEVGWVASRLAGRPTIIKSENTLIPIQSN